MIQQRFAFDKELLLMIKNREVQAKFSEIVKEVS